MTKAKQEPETNADGPGLEAFIGQPILLLCQNYFYHGILYGVCEDFLLLKDPSIVYETGEWSDKKYKDSQRLPATFWRVMRASVESYGVGK